MSGIIDDLFGLEGTTAVVTGAGKGLGRSAAVALARAGARVVVCARTEQDLRDTAQLIAAAGGVATTHVLDVSDRNRVRALFDQYPRVDIVLNAAAVVHRQQMLTMTDAAWDESLQTNLTGAFFVGRAAAKTMVEHGVEGRIIQMSSVVASVARPTLGAYAASKAGVIQLVQSLAYARWSRHRITVNAILPGFFATEGYARNFDTPSEWLGQFEEQVPGGLPGQPADLDTTVLYLASRASSYTTGASIVVDGGLTAGIPL